MDSTVEASWVHKETKGGRRQISVVNHGPIQADGRNGGHLEQEGWERGGRK